MLLLTGNAVLDITGTLTNTGVLDLISWTGTLPSGFINNGIVLDRSAVKIDAFAITGSAFPSLSKPTPGTPTSSSAWKPSAAPGRTSARRARATTPSSPSPIPKEPPCRGCSTA